MARKAKQDRVIKKVARIIENIMALMPKKNRNALRKDIHKLAIKCEARGKKSASQDVTTERAAHLLELAKARLDEAKWWEHLSGDEHITAIAVDAPCPYCQHIADLEAEAAKND